MNGKSNKSLRGHDVITNVCSKIDLKEPRLFTSTNLRKYVATISQLVDMNETEMGWLARQLGHDIHVHKDFYRLPDTTLQLAVLATYSWPSTRDEPICLKRKILETSN